MLVAIILAAVVIIGGIVVVAMGYGGELARPPVAETGCPDFGSAVEVALYRPPAALLGYDARATEHALQLISRTMADRDAEIDWLRARLRDLMPEGTRQDGTLARLSGATTDVPAGQPTAPGAGGSE